MNNRFYKWTLGAFSPVPADDNMTLPVGYRDGQLFTYDRGVSQIIADAYSITTAYIIGDYAIYNEKLYRCISPTIGSFDEAKWEEVQIVDLIGEVNTKAQNAQTAADEAQNTADNAYGVGGQFSIAVSDWDTGTQSYTKTIPGLGVNDKIDLYPKTKLDQDNGQGNGLFVTDSADSVVITYDIIPTQTLTFKYFITPGRA